ncbi:MAG TPA: chalcone isomerase family protein, partial [Thermoanaerobaculia bacterium]|nr:chalcone isomerase family protein [Thermoanaerobaculia bacterium]
IPMNTRNLVRASGAALFAVALALPASARELSGVTMPDTMTVGEKTLKLNGMGLRKKAIFKVYVAGLYVEAPSKDAAAILAADAARIVKMQYLRNVEKAKITEAFREGFENNAKELAARQKANIDRMIAAVPDLKDGETMSFTYVPGKGTTLSHNGKDLLSVEGKEFADTVFLLWLGPKPPSDDLKKGLLGG